MNSKELNPQTIKAELSKYGLNPEQWNVFHEKRTLRGQSLLFHNKQDEDFKLSALWERKGPSIEFKELTLLSI